MNDSTTKPCRKCGIEYPATAEFFIVDNRNRNPITDRCRVCHNKMTKENQRRRRADPLLRQVDNARLKQSRDARRDEYNQSQRDYYREWINLGNNREHTNYRQRKNRAIRIVTVPGYLEAFRRYSINQAHKRRALKLTVGGNYTSRDIELQRKAQTDSKGVFRCWWCNKPLSSKYHIDHRIPLSKGGSNFPNNLCLSCSPCNLSKSARYSWEWNGRLL